MSEAGATQERIRPIFIVCPQCEGVGFILFDSEGFIGFEEPRGLMRMECEKCGGTGEIIARDNAESSQKKTNEE